jgi:hypothetical protein
MHFNENSQRNQAKTQEGEDRWVVIYPKVHKGEKCIARKIKEEPTYSKLYETAKVFLFYPTFTQVFGTQIFFSVV